MKTETPSNLTYPFVGLLTPTNNFASVVFPAPELPITVQTAGGEILNDNESRTNLSLSNG